MSDLLYISGPMAGLPDHNYPAFATATSLLRDNGYNVISPHELGPIPGWEWADYLRRDLMVMLSMGGALTGIAALPDVPDSERAPSRGRALEIHVATELGVTVRPVTEWMGPIPANDSGNGMSIPGAGIRQTRDGDIAGRSSDHR